MPNAGPPAASNRRRYLKIVGLLVPLVGTLVSAPWVGELIKERFLKNPADVEAVTIQRAVIYAKLLFFRDKSKGEKALLSKELRLAGGNTKLKTQLYDEALYLKAYYFNRQKKNTMQFVAHSSGIVDVTPILPSSATWDVHHFDQSGYKSLSYDIDVTDRDYILIAHHYYNGFQFNSQKNQYESDGGVHFHYAVDEAVIVFDFSSLVDAKSESTFRLKSAPTLWIQRPLGKSKEPLESTFLNGILTSKTIKAIQPESHIFCDWKWETEPQ